jgi:hypothetical protein
MGLLIKLNNGDTQLKSLKFGNDRPGGGNSGQPYIQKQIFDKTPSPLGTDFLLRGGAYAPFSAAEDVVRLTKYMFDKNNPSGLLFVAKQNLLSRTGVKTEASKGVAYAGGAINEGIYTPLSTLAEAGVGFTGAHLYKQGLDPLGLFPGATIKKYEDVLKNQPGSENRLVRLQELNSTGDTSLQTLYSKITLNTPTSVMVYGGGPGSILGVGNTYIRYADQRTGKENPNIPKNFFTNLGYENYSVFKSPRQLLWQGAKIFNGSTVSGVYKTITGIDPLDNEYSTTNNSVELQLFSDSVYKPGTLTPQYGITGSNGYQTRKPFLTQAADTTYSSPINQFVLKTYNRHLAVPVKFDDGTTNPNGTARTWAVQTGKEGEPVSFILPYSSTKTLTRDNTDDELNRIGKGNLWDEFNSYYGFGGSLNGINPHNKGYLADLDKNAGTWLDPASKLTSNNNNAYPGGIAPDFRLVPRTIRGLGPLRTTQQPESGSFRADNGVISVQTGEVSTTWINAEGNLKSNTLDKIYYESSAHKSSFRTSTNPFEAPDLVNFIMDVINPETPSSGSKSLRFRAYIDSFSDSYNPEWNSQTYMGRAEKFYKYNSFERNISLGFTVVAESKSHLQAMYNQLNLLASSLAPTYTTFGYMTGNLHRLTLGNYINGQYGIVTGFTYDVIEESPWEIDDGSQLPFYIKVNGFNFIPIHNFRPETTWNGVNPHQFINQTSPVPQA